MQAKIYQPTKSAMQSGTGNTKKWILEYEGERNDRFIENIMGWVASKNAKQRLIFSTKEEAIRFASDHNIPYEVLEPKVRKIVKKSYADNFK